MLGTLGASKKDQVVDYSHDDGSCLAFLLGCTDSRASSYVATAKHNNGNGECVYLG